MRDGQYVEEIHGMEPVHSHVGLAALDDMTGPPVCRTCHRGMTLFRGEYVTAPRHAQATWWCMAHDTCTEVVSRRTGIVTREWSPHFKKPNA